MKVITLKLFFALSLKKKEILYKIKNIYAGAAFCSFFNTKLFE